jgi:hypothetical protein
MRIVPDHRDRHKDEPDFQDVIDRSQRVSQTTRANGGGYYEGRDNGYAPSNDPSGEGIDLDLEGTLHDGLASHGGHDSGTDSGEEQGDGECSGCGGTDHRLEGCIQAVKVGKVLILVDSGSGDDFPACVDNYADDKDVQAEVACSIAECRLNGTKAGPIVDAMRGLGLAVGGEVVLSVIVDKARSRDGRTNVESVRHEHSSDHAACSVQALADEDLARGQESLEDWASGWMDLAEADATADENDHDESSHEELKISNIAKGAGGRIKHQEEERIKYGDNTSSVEREFGNEKVPGKGSTDDSTNFCTDGAGLCDDIDEQFQPARHILVVHLSQVESGDGSDLQTKILQNHQLMTILQDVMRSHSPEGNTRSEEKSEPYPAACNQTVDHLEPPIGNCLDR